MQQTHCCIVHCNLWGFSTEWYQEWLGSVRFSSVPFRAVTRHHREFSVMGTPSLQPFLKSYWLTPVQMTGQLSQSMQIWRARDSINVMHLWLNLADLKEADRKVLLNAPVTPSGLFGDAVESITERFAEAQKRAKAMSHVMPRRAFQQQTASSRSSSAPGSSQRRDIPRPAPAVGTATAPRQEPDVRRKVWGPSRKRQGQRRSPRRDSRPPPAAKPSSWRSEDRRRAREQPSSQAPKVQLLKCVCWVFIQ